MDSYLIQNLLVVIALIFIINIPFGMWRGMVAKFSLHWFLAIHLPVAIAIVLRHFFEIEFSWARLPFFVVAFFLGQRLGMNWLQKQASVVRP